MILYHGTSIKNAQSILKQQKFSPERFGTGADVRFTKGTVGVFGIGQGAGFYGSGTYFTSSPDLALIYSEARKSGKGKILEVDVRGKILDAEDKDGLIPKLRTFWVNRVRQARSSKGMSAMTDDQLRQAFDVEVLEYVSGYVSEVNKYARDAGYDGAKFSDSEIVVWNLGVVSAIRPYAGDEDIDVGEGRTVSVRRHDPAKSRVVKRGQQRVETIMRRIR